jgi:hypothetical protein
MNRTLGFLSLSLAAFLLLAGMLATPLVEINHLHAVPVVADGTTPVPPPPFSAATGALLADGTTPVPPPPFSLSEGITVADGTTPVPPPPFSLSNAITVADGTTPVPPPPFLT